jgi:2-keto-3-deoxy-L-rhamnonate aldolase RhmA
MRNSKILVKTRAGQPARIAMMGYFLPNFIAHAASLGYDGIWLDLEHRAFDRREVQALLAYFHLYDIDCLLRPPTREKGELYRYLEDGATGLIVPHVSDVSSARELVQKVKFPPVGDRGLEGRGLETNFGLDIPQTRDPLVAHALRETFLIVQIETPQGLAAAAEIAAIPGIDGLYVGPQDLRIRLLNLPEGERVTVDEAIRQVAALCKQHGKLWGSLARTLDELREHHALGSQLLVWGIDARMIEAGLAQSSGELGQVMSDE